MTSLPMGSAMKGSGLLLTHDWAQLHTEHGLVDTTETLKVEDSGYQTVSFPISSTSQYEACISGQMVCGEQNVSSCPLEIDPSSGSCRSGSCRSGSCSSGSSSSGSCSSGSCSSGSSCSGLPRPFSAVVRVTYKVTNAVLGSKNRTLCKAARSELEEIMEKMLEDKDEVDGSITYFLHKFGSHFQCGAQRLGKAFMRMVMVDEVCDMKLLTDIAEEIFEICDAHEKHFPGTKEGSWYSSKQFFNTVMFSEEKKQLLKDTTLRISHTGVQAESVNLQEWKNSTDNQPENLNGIDNTFLVSAWELINLQFENSEKLASAIKEGWKRLVNSSTHKDADVPHNPPVINIPWCRLVEDLGMEEYYPCKLLLHNAHCIPNMPERCEKKEELLWRVLSQLMLTDPQCREQEVNNYAIVAQQGHLPKKRSGLRNKSSVKDTKIPTVPHPMDVLLLLFTCSDFMLRQVLARKLFLCRLAIPFIVPVPSLETVEMLIWPLRSIIMEWIDKEEALVNCKLNMVTFVRCGKTSFSKSKLLNKLLSASGYPSFFQQELPGGNHKRLISNGTVEMSHFLPGGSQDNQFIEPALFFNLRGDACDHPVQHQVLMDLSTTVVVLIDIGELSNQRVKQKLKSTLATKKKDVIVVLTNSRNIDKENIELQTDSFVEHFGDEIDVDEDVVTTFEIEGSGDKNISTVILDIKEVIARKMATGHQKSIESLKMTEMPHVLIDEIENRHSRDANEVAEDLLTSLKQLDSCERKEKLLPLQGDCLLEIGKLLRQLHRNSSKDASLRDKEEIKEHIKAIRNEQATALNNDPFVMKVISLFNHEAETIKFTIRLVQQKLDILSRAILPKLQAEKNCKWKALSEARNQHDKDQVVVLGLEVQKAEKKVADASCGWEHLMREVGQLYEVSMELKMMEGRPPSMFPLPKLSEIVGRQLLDGHPVELMDGDHGVIPIEWVKAVFRSLAELAGLEKKIFVMSVMGIQSSGKSTLLNTMFGLEFAVSAGRCTRGIYAQLLPVADREDLPFHYILVLDSEGLKSQEQENQNFEHDNELATLVIGLADLALINLKGENPREITDVLQIVVYAFLRMKLADSPHKRQCMFIHQNVSAINAQHKLAGDRQKLLEELDRMTLEASIAQGLSSETISAFNQIISFDCHRDVVYFSDLWNGNPPMANVNEGYSNQAAHTRQNIMEQISNNFKGFITVVDFISRLEDIWNGVLTDDFIFSFRNTLAAKAYLEMERECARLTLQVEEELLHWINTDCKIQMESTKSEDQLHQKHGELKKSLNVKLSALIAAKIELLGNFFEKHHAREIIVHWKSEKQSSVQLYCETLGRQRETDLENMKTRTLFHIRQGSEAQKHEQEIIRNAITVAETMRGRCPPDDELEKQFDRLWEQWSAYLAFTQVKPSFYALDVLFDVLWDKMKSEGNTKYFQDQVEWAPIAVKMKTIPVGGIVKEHIIVKTMQYTWKGIVRKIVMSKSNYFQEALERANELLQGAMEEAKVICREDITFNHLHGRQIFDYLFQEISKHNGLSYDKVNYTFTPEFQAMMAFRVAHCTAPMFDRMNQQFEEKHGVHAQVQAYRRRVFLLFKNTVKDTSAEVTAADDFREMIKGKIMEYVKIELEQSVLSELYHAVGNTKYDLITKILDAIAQSGNTQKQNNFESLIAYVTDPLDYARRWLKKFCDKLLFCHDGGQSKYSELAEHIAGKIIKKIVSSTTAATNTVAGLDEKERHNAWTTAFCDNIKDTLPIDRDQLRLTAGVASFGNFQNFLEDGLKRLETDVKAAFSQVKKGSVEWLAKESPHQKAAKFLWGCPALCPFCREPCQCSDPIHMGSHRCVQHRPTGIGGTFNSGSKELSMTTCTVDITSSASFTCNACHLECYNTVHCFLVPEIVRHPYREYKKFLPDWDIAPDPADTASKYWQWAICTFQKQIRQQYEGTKLEIPVSWKHATAQQAINSLRVYH